jgi:hypothetical protein
MKLREAKGWWQVIRMGAIIGLINLIHATSCPPHYDDPLPLCCPLIKEGKMNRKAIRECAEWLSYCLKIGWTKGQLDELEKIWWKYHDKGEDSK